MNLIEEIHKAGKRIQPHIKQTQLLYSEYLSQLNGGCVYLKLENEQHTGSFKARGALNKILSLAPEEKSTGLITASTGNHAQGFARALSISGDSGVIYLPENAAQTKVEALQQYTASLKFHGKDCLTTELHAKQIAQEKQAIWVSPYNDPMIIAGQGTIGKEITDQLSSIDSLLACIGGGGLMSGISSWFKNESPSTEIIGCLPANSPEMMLSVEKGEIVTIEPKETLSDGSAGGLENGSITYDICAKNVARYILASEEEIANAIRLVYNQHDQIIEGAAGVAVASFMKNVNDFTGQTVVIVICGGNIAQDKLDRILQS